jgi:hypothetical protein
VNLMVTAAMAALLVGLATFVHYEVLRLCHEKLPALRFVAGRAKVLLAMGAAFCSHLAQIAIFAAAYAFLQAIALGKLHGALRGTAMGFLYFSAETYTSLGFGDVYPVGEMRLIAGIEALTGLLMISWTASFTYLEMGRHWLARER